MDEHKQVYQRCFSHLLEYVSFRPRTSYEIRAKIGKYLDYYPDISSEDRVDFVENMLTELLEMGLFSDIGFAQKYIEEQFSSSQPKSPNEVQVFLSRKGISRDDAAAALELYDSERQYDVVVRLVNKKKLPKDKLRNFLIRKGFSFEIISRALETI